MQSDRDKEQTRTVGVGMAEDVAGVDLAQNVFNGHSGTNHVRRVVHRKNDAGHDLNVQTDAAKATEFPKDVQVTRGWIVVKVAMTGRKSGLFQKSPPTLATHGDLGLKFTLCLAPVKSHGAQGLSLD